MAALEAPASHSPELEARLSEVETRLAALGNALRARDPVGIDLHAAELHRALARATAALDRAIDVLLPGDSVPLYTSIGSAERGMLKGGVISA